MSLPCLSQSFEALVVLRMFTMMLLLETYWSRLHFVNETSDTFDLSCSSGCATNQDWSNWKPIDVKRGTVRFSLCDLSALKCADAPLVATSYTQKNFLHNDNISSVEKKNLLPYLYFGLYNGPQKKPDLCSKRACEVFYWVHPSIATERSYKDAWSCIHSCISDDIWRQEGLVAKSSTSLLFLARNFRRYERTREETQACYVSMMKGSYCLFIKNLKHTVSLHWL